MAEKWDEKSDTKIKDVPITMRVSTKVIDTLKEIARQKSYETSEDISYVDLIREAIFGSFELAEDCKNDEEENTEKLIVDDSPRDFWTPSEIERFNQSDIGKMISKCVESNQYDDFVTLWKEQLDLWIKHRCIGNKILLPEKKIPGRIYEFTRDAASVAFIIPRRGAIPDSVVEGETCLIPPFQVGSYPTFRTNERSPHMLFSSMCASIKSIQKEIDSNVIKAFLVCSDCRNQTVKGIRLEPQMFLTAIQNVAQHGVAPAFITMSAQDYCEVHCVFGKDFLKAPNLKVALETKKYGTIWGIPIVVSERISKGSIIVSAAAKSVGVLVEMSPSTITFTDEPKRCRIGFVQTVEIGIAVSNDWAISVIEVIKPTKPTKQISKEKRE